MKITMKMIKKLSLLTIIMMTGMIFATDASAQKLLPKSTMTQYINSYVNVWNTGNVNDLDKFVDQSAKRTLPQSARDYSSKTLADIKTEITQFRKAFPNATIRINKTALDDKYAFVSWTLTGTNSVKIGSYPGNNKSVNIKGVSVVYFQFGKIVEEVAYYDIQEFRKQLGMPPSNTQVNADDGDMSEKGHDGGKTKKY